MDDFDSLILNINVLVVIVLLTVVCSLLFRKKNARANIFLAILVFYPVSTVVHNVISIFWGKPELLFLNAINGGINFTLGPVLLVYLTLIQGRDIRSALSGPWHFVPSALTFLSAGYYFLIPYEEKVQAMAKVQAGEEPFFNIMSLLLVIHVGYYLYIGWKMIRLYEQKAGELGMDEAENSVKWQRAFLLCLVKLNGLLLLAYFLPLVIWGSSHVYLDLVAIPVVSLFMYAFMIYKGLSYHVIFDKPAYSTFAESVAPLNDFMEEVGKLENAPVSNAAPSYDSQLKAKLEQLFTADRIHTQSGLKLVDVAALLHIRPAALSTFINTHLDMTFFEMVNRYRVEEAKQMLIDDGYHHYKVDYIGDRAGFNSRASFFRVFKKNVGKTPQDFREAYTQKTPANTEGDVRPC